MSSARQHILDTLTDALIDGSAEGLRVGDLLRTANVNRSTFYYHFRSLDDAYKQLVEEGLEPIEKYLRLSHDATGTTLQGELFKAYCGFFAHIKTQARLYHALLWSNLRDRFLSDFVEHMELCMRSNLLVRPTANMPGRDTTNDEIFQTVFCRVVAYQQFSILEAWALQDFQQDPEVVAEFSYIINTPDTDLYSLEVSPYARSRRRT